MCYLANFIRYFVEKGGIPTVQPDKRRNGISLLGPGRNVLCM
jgi:hypothetical protein